MYIFHKVLRFLSVWKILHFVWTRPRTLSLVISNYAVPDSGLPRRGWGGTQEGGDSNILFGIIFVENCMKNERLGTEGVGCGGGRPSAPRSATVKYSSCLQCEMLPAVIIWTACHSVNPVTVTVGRETNKYSGTSSRRSAYWAFNPIERKETIVMLHYCQLFLPFMRVKPL